jgi:hypothetical protein
MNPVEHQFHFHITWSSKATPDWEPFTSRAEAEAAATAMVRPGESFEVQEADGDCSVCKPKAKMAR